MAVVLVAYPTVDPTVNLNKYLYLLKRCSTLNTQSDYILHRKTQACRLELNQ